MSKLNFDVETLLTPPQVKSAILDFSNRRPKIWPNLSTKQYEVYSAGQTEADVREGSEMLGMTMWAREHYDWSGHNSMDCARKQFLHARQLYAGYASGAS